MDASDKAEVHMQMDENAKHKYGSSTNAMRSASISIPMHSLDSSNMVNNFLGHSGSLHSERKISYMQMSGPLYNS